MTLCQQIFISVNRYLYLLTKGPGPSLLSHIQDRRWVTVSSITERLAAGQTVV